MKQELLENLIRLCAKEVLSQKAKINESDEADKEEGDNSSIGAEAPPEGGQGIADQPPIEDPKDTTPEQPSEPQTPEPEPTNLKGIILVNPRNKAKLPKVPLEQTNDADLERDLHKIATTVGGAGTKVSLGAIRMVKDTLKNKNSTIYLYVGKYDPTSEELFLLADKSLSVAKDSSISPEELGDGRNKFDPQVAPSTDDDYANKYADQYKTFNRAEQPVQDDDPEINERLKTMITKMVKEVFDNK